MNGDEVGVLTNKRGQLSFAYEGGWLERDNASPISSSLPMSPEQFVSDDVANFFDNLLPDNVDIRRHIQATLDARSAQPFDLLEATGADCVGAVQLLPENATPDVRRVDATPISDADIAELLRGPVVDRPLGMTREDEEFRISVAGAQHKTALLWLDDGWHRPGGATPTTHIFKPPIGPLGLGEPDMSDSVENEWLCLRIAAAFGLPVASADIHSFEEHKALVVERFDRRWSKNKTWIIRLPQEDLCQALGVPPAKKYEVDGGPGIDAILAQLEASHDPAHDRRMFMKAVFMFWLLAAPDGHAKNFSLALLPQGRTRLLPLYDILSAYPALARRELPKQKLEMAMSVRGKNRHRRWLEISRRHWQSTVKQGGFPVAQMNDVMDECADVVEAVIDDVGGSIPPGFDRRVADSIFDGLRETKSRLGRLSKRR